MASNSTRDGVNDTSLANQVCPACFQKGILVCYWRKIDAMKISVIIPCYNRAHTLSRALDSVLAQTHRADQIIVVDDASSDDTRTLLSRYPRIDTLFLAQNQGVSAARNAGLEQAKHEWIALLDSDDEWLPEKLARQVDAIVCNPQTRIFHTNEIWIRHGKRVNAMNKHAKPDGHVYRDSLALCCVSPSSILMHRSVLDECGVFDESLPACEDYDLWLRLFHRYPVRLIDQALLIKYGGHDDQLSRQFWGMDRFRIRALMKMLDMQVLSVEDDALTRAMLRKKCRVMIKGAKKRGNTERETKYATYIEHYEPR